MNTRQVDEYLKRLKSQKDFLEEKLQDREEEESHYLRAELVAMQWAIEYIEDTILEAAVHQGKWLNERTGE